MSYLYERGVKIKCNTEKLKMICLALQESTQGVKQYDR